ncbi:hypothetical protein [Streptomyces rubrogriseus]|uniref:hypothetical protein n=1 Tax=Streptomyces rubrogriseus TaxID=194673 RepID=UPI000D59E57E|nr:hypothetical protein [Streptomyces rubrogriseus]
MRENDLDRALRQHSEAVREERTQLANDALRAEGKPLKHCGVEAKSNRHGDWVCRRCGDIF